jgi:hypothetical protein
MPPNGGVDAATAGQRAPMIELALLCEKLAGGDSGPTICSAAPGSE